MTMTSARRAALSCALLATTAFCGLTAQPAAAQSGITPSSRPAPDGNGVDVITGELNVPLRSVSIGRPGESGLTYSSGIVDGARQDTFVLEASGGGTVAFVNIQGRTATFTRNGAGVYVPDDADGSTFTPWGDDFIYTARDGTRIEFLNDHGDGLVGARGDRIVRPDGEQIRYHYKVAPQPPCPTGDPCLHPDGNGGVRVQSITSNLGYQLKATYAGNDYATDPASWNTLTKVTAINNAVDFCNPDGESCTLSQVWPALLLGHTENGSTTTDTLQDNSSQTVTVTSNAQGPIAISAPADPAANLSLTYHPDGRVQTVTRGGGTWSYAYSGNTTTVTQPLGGTRIYEWNPTLRRVESEKDELGRTTRYGYDGNGRLVRTTFPEENYIELLHDARGNVTQTRRVEKSGTGPGDIVTSAKFPLTCSNQKTCNKPESVTDGRGNTTDFAYHEESHGGIRTVTAPAPTPNAARPQVRMYYSPLLAYYKNPLGNIVQAQSAVTRLTATSACQKEAACQGTADEVKTTIAYGLPGVANNLLPTSMTTTSGDGDPSGKQTATVAQTYDAFGNVVTADGPLPGDQDTSYFSYQANRQISDSRSPDPDGPGEPLPSRITRYTHSTDGLVSTAESGTIVRFADGTWSAPTISESVELARDTLGRPVKQTLFSGGPANRVAEAVVQTSYDIKGRPLCTAQRMNRDEYGSLPDSACDPDTAGAFGPDRISKTLYDQANQVREVQSALGTADAAKEAAYTYHRNGQVETATDGEDNRTTYLFDGHDRLRFTQFPVAAKGANASNPGDFEELGYDAGGNVTSRRVRDGKVIGYGYDALNRLTNKNLPNTAVLEGDSAFGYDLLGRLASASDSLGHQQSFGYDALGRRLNETSNWFGTTSSEYDPAGRRKRLTWRDGFSVTYEHHATGEMKAVRENSGFLLASFGYDGLGRRTSLTRGNGTVTSCAPNAASRLETLTQTFAAASAPNNLALGFVYNPAGQIVSNARSNDLFSWTGSVAGTTASEVNGLNQIDRHNGVQFSHDAKGNLLSDGTRSYSYTADNRLASGGSTDIYYDPLGRLAHLTGSATDLRYNGAQYIEESDWNGGPTRRRYVHGPGTDEPLVWYEGAGNTDRRYLHADERGSVVAVSDDSGNVLGINKYDEYGVPAATNIGSFGYTGQVWLPELGLWHYKARMYDPKLGRFLQPDPIGYGAGMNMYAYVGGDPVNFNDPSGLRPCAWDEILIVHPQRRVYGSDGVVTSSRRECVTRQWLKENPDFSGGVYGSPVTGGDGGGDTPDQPVTPPVPVPAPLKPCSIRMPNIAFEMDVGVFAGLGGGFKLGLTFDADRGTLTAYRSVRAGYGVGLIAGIGLSLTDDGPSQGWEGSRDNFSMGYGWWGFGVSEPTGTIGDTTVNGGVSFGPKVGVELSRTQSINHRVDLTTEGSSLCQN